MILGSWKWSQSKVATEQSGPTHKNVRKPRITIGENLEKTSRKSEKRLFRCCGFSRTRQGSVVTVGFQPQFCLSSQKRANGLFSLDLPILADEFLGHNIWVYGWCESQAWQCSSSSRIAIAFTIKYNSLFNQNRLSIQSFGIYRFRMSLSRLRIKHIKNMYW